MIYRTVFKYFLMTIRRRSLLFVIILTRLSPIWRSWRILINRTSCWRLITKNIVDQLFLKTVIKSKFSNDFRWTKITSVTKMRYSLTCMMATSGTAAIFGLWLIMIMIIQTDKITFSFSNQTHTLRSNWKRFTSWPLDDESSPGDLNNSVISSTWSSVSLIARCIQSLWKLTKWMNVTW